MKILKLIPIITLTAFNAHAATSFIGDPIGTDDNLGTASNWDNGLPGSGNDGSISTDGELGNISIANGGSSVTVTHTSGTIGTRMMKLPPTGIFPSALLAVVHSPGRWMEETTLNSVSSRSVQASL